MRTLTFALCVTTLAPALCCDAGGLYVVEYGGGAPSCPRLWLTSCYLSGAGDESRQER